MSDKATIIIFVILSMFIAYFAITDTISARSIPKGICNPYHAPEETNCSYMALEQIREIHNELYLLRQEVNKKTCTTQMSGTTSER